MRRLTLCADDFALSRPISETIAELAHAGKINAISCMAVCGGWVEDSQLLRDLPATVQVGLHLTLTDERPLTAMSGFAPEGHMPNVNALALKARFGRLPIAQLKEELIAQFEDDSVGVLRLSDFEPFR